MILHGQTCDVTFLSEYSDARIQLYMFGVITYQLRTVSRQLAQLCHNNRRALLYCAGARGSIHCTGHRIRVLNQPAQLHAAETVRRAGWNRPRRTTCTRKTNTQRCAHETGLRVLELSNLAPDRAECLHGVSLEDRHRHRSLCTRQARTAKAAPAHLRPAACDGTRSHQGATFE